MARKPCTFRQGDLTKAVKGAQAAGLEVVRVEIGKDGKIVVVAGNGGIEQDASRTYNEWDDAKAA